MEHKSSVGKIIILGICRAVCHSCTSALSSVIVNTLTWMHMDVTVYTVCIIQIDFRSSGSKRVHNATGKHTLYSWFSLNEPDWYHWPHLLD